MKNMLLEINMYKGICTYMAVVTISLFFGGFASAQNTDSFESIDNYARKCPASATQTVSTLAAYLQKCCKNDLDKARVIYVWIAENISYDHVAYNSGQYNDCSADEVLRLRTSVCEGFSNLYQSLGLKMDLDVHRISGYAKGYSYASGAKFTQPNHSWNSIRINGDWRLFDVTWGQGYGYNNNGKLVCVKQFCDFWFNTDPYAFVFSHFPVDTKYMLIDSCIGFAEFGRLPSLNPQDFQHGLSARVLFQYFEKQQAGGFPIFYDDTPKQLKIIQIPLSYVLQKGKKYHFAFAFPKGSNMNLKDSQYKTYTFKKQNEIFTLDYIPTVSGKITIYTRQINEDGIQVGYMRYNVK